MLDQGRFPANLHVEKPARFHGGTVPEKSPFVVFNIYDQEPVIRRYCRLLGIKAEFHTVSAEEARNTEKLRHEEMHRRGIEPIVDGRANTGLSIFDDAPKGLKNVDVSKVPWQLVERRYGLIGLYPRRHPAFDAAGRIRVGVYKPLLRIVMGCLRGETKMDPIYLENFVNLLLLGAARHVHGRTNDHDVNLLLLGGFDSQCNEWLELTVCDNEQWAVQKMGRVSERQSA